MASLTSDGSELRVGKPTTENRRWRGGMTMVEDNGEK